MSKKSKQLLGVLRELKRIEVTHFILTTGKLLKNEYLTPDLNKITNLN